MKKYDFKKAHDLIWLHKDELQSAYLGVHEDWFWTAESVFENGNFLHDVENLKEVAGISGSVWGTPALNLNFKDGTEKMVPCYIGESTGIAPSNFLGALSQAAQNNITPLSDL